MEFLYSIKYKYFMKILFLKNMKIKLNFYNYKNFK
jgi:hypothetical protein